jgi:hypothetical protein
VVFGGQRTFSGGPGAWRRIDLLQHKRTHAEKAAFINM